MYLTVVSHARSGSTYFVHLLARCAPLRAYAEIFQFSDEAIARALGPDRYAMCASLGLEGSGAGLRAAVTRDTAHYLRKLQALDPNSIPAFKIFPHHLESAAMLALFRGSAALIKLRRNPLHAYISAEIARKVGTYIAIDTSAVKVRFDALGLFRFGLALVQHFSWLDDVVREAAVPCAEFDYERLVESADAVGDVQAALSLLLPEVHFEACLAPGKRFDPGVYGESLVRQDRRESALDKVDNPEVMMQALEHAGLAGYVDRRAAMQTRDWKLGLARLFEVGLSKPVRH